MIAEVIIDSKAKKLNRRFDYKIPEKLEDIITIGSRVLVPFGNFKTLEEAYVINIKEFSEYEVKEIASLEENLEEDKINLARWMARKYFSNVSECVKLMLTPGTRNKNKENRVKDKKIEFAYLAINKEDINIESLKGEKQKKVMQFLSKNEGSSVSEIEIFTECTKATINSLVKRGYIKLQKEKVNRSPLVKKEIKVSQKLKLTDEQNESYKRVVEAMDEKMFKEFLLYGVTGSGKTEVYLQLIERCLDEEKTAIILVPEISLTPQMIDRFVSRFGKEKIAVLHSKLSIGERHDEWIRIKENKAKIVIGARSAIFAPLSNLGIIIIDEEHDLSYKSETDPRYNAKEVALEIAKNKNIPVLLGSATPDLKTFYNVQNGIITLLKLSKRANKSKLPEVEVVDLRNELINPCLVRNYI